MKVYVLVIDNRHGTTIDAFDSQEKLDACLADYCADSWTWDDPCPEDREAMIEAYWERQSNYGEEWHKTEQFNF